MAEQIQEKIIEQEMKESYLDYAMSVIVGRALPDVRDGLKPVHRRILFAMHEMGLRYNRPFTKCARIVGDCFKYHPHGDTAIYDALVRMAQDFSLRYPLVNGHGNFGSIEGFDPAQMRYTEARLSKIAEEMLVDIDKNTVNFISNFDGSLKEPVVLPAKFPNLLVNGSAGIAVGMATNIPPHNLREVSDAILTTITNPEIEIEELMKHIKGPDFPTGAYILGLNGVKLAYKTGRGKVTIRAKTEIKDNKIIVTEIPYQVNKTALIEGIANLVREKRIEGISDIRDESDRKGMSIVIITRKDSNAEVILNQLYKHSMLQVSFGIIMLALDNNQPRIMNLKQLIDCYINHRKDVVIRRTRFDLKKAEDRSHILEGLRIALSNIDEIIKLIKNSKDPGIAKQKLIRNYSLTEIQSQAILDMRLQRLTSLEQEKIKEEYENLQNFIKELKGILASDKRILDIIKDEILGLKQEFEDRRRTEILDVEEEIETEDLISEESVVITATKSGYIKRLPVDTYKQQRRGGKGIIAAETKDDDFVKNIFITSTHNYLLFFSNKGRVYWLKAYKIPEASRYSRGKAVVNLLKLEREEEVTTVMAVHEFDDKHYLIMATKNGLIKKINLKRFSKPRKTGVIAITLKNNDELIQVRLTPGTLKIILGSRNGAAVKFDEKDIRESGRLAAGVRGIRLSKGDKVVGMEVARSDASLFTITENGYGKRTRMSEYRLIKRGGKGVRNIKTSERNGKVVGIKTVMEEDEFILVTKKGIMIRVSVMDISVIGRNTQGVRIMRLDEGDKIASIARINENANNRN